VKRALLLFLLAACPGPSGGPDAMPMTFTGGYEDWDSANASFLGVFDATVTDVANSSITATTAPNGRSTLTMEGAPGEVTFVATDYLPGRYTVDPDVVAAGPYEIRGIKTSRVTTFFANELGGVTYDASKALVEIEVRTDGAAITVAGAATGGFHGDASVGWSAGATQAGGAAYVVFPNVAPGDIALGVTPPNGKTCHAPATIHAEAGELAMTTVACQ